jgi:hypothetical protein
MKILHKGVEYELNPDFAIGSGAMVRVKKPIKFDDLAVDTLFFYDGGDSKGLFVKSGKTDATRIAGTKEFNTPIGKADKGAAFYCNPDVSILKDGEWVSERK